MARIALLGGNPLVLAAPVPNLTFCQEASQLSITSLQASGCFSKFFPDCFMGRIFVGGVPYEVDEDFLANAFQHLSGGPVQKAEIVRRPTGQSKGFGFVQFYDDTAVFNVVWNATRLFYEGGWHLKVNVNVAEPRAPPRLVEIMPALPDYQALAQRSLNMERASRREPSLQFGGLGFAYQHSGGKKIPP